MQDSLILAWILSASVIFLEGNDITNNGRPVSGKPKKLWVHEFQRKNIIISKYRNDNVVD